MNLTLLHPWAGLFLLIIPLLILLYFLKLRRPRVTVASTLLWKQVMEDLRVNAPFQRLRRSLLLLLQILILLAMIAALLRPLGLIGKRTAESQIILLDCSASMQARDQQGRSRFDLARKKIRARIAALSSESEIALITFADRPVVIQPFTDNKNLLRRKLARVVPTDGHTRPAAAIQLAASIANSRKTPRILIYSDGGAAVRVSADLRELCQFIQVGTPGDNLAVTALDVRRAFGERQHVQLFVSAHNYGTRPFAGAMTLSLDGKIQDSRDVKIGSGKTYTRIFESNLRQDAFFQVHFSIKDALASDNQAWLTVPAPVIKRILLVSDTGRFLAKALAPAPDIKLTQVAPAAAAAALKQQDWFAVIWHHTPPLPTASSHVIYIDCLPPESGFQYGEALRRPGTIDWNTVHPITRFLDFTNLITGPIRKLLLPRGITPVLWTEKTPLIVQWSDREYGRLWIGFDPEKSNWPLLMSFPVCLNNCIGFFAGLAPRSRWNNLTVGDLPVAADHGGGIPELEYPDHHRVAMQPDGNGGYSLSPLSRCGLYRIHEGKKSYPIAVNLYDPEESDLRAPPHGLEGDRQTVTVASAQPEIIREYWSWILAFALILLIGEWLIFHRRPGGF